MAPVTLLVFSLLLLATASAKPGAIKDDIDTTPVKEPDTETTPVKEEDGAKTESVEEEEVSTHVTPSAGEDKNSNDICILQRQPMAGTPYEHIKCTPNTNNTDASKKKVKCIPRHIEYRYVGLKGRYMEVHSDCVDVREAGCGVFEQTRRYFPNTTKSQEVTVGKCYEESCSDCHVTKALKPVGIRFLSIDTPDQGSLSLKTNPSCGCRPTCRLVSNKERVMVYDKTILNATLQEIDFGRCGVTSEDGTTRVRNGCLFDKLDRLESVGQLWSLNLQCQPAETEVIMVVNNEGGEKEREIIKSCNCLQ